MRVALILGLVAAALVLFGCGDRRHVDGRLSPYRYVVLERVDEDPPAKGDARAEAADVFRQLGFEVLAPERAAADAAVAGETVQCYARIWDTAYTARLEVTLRDLRSGAEAYVSQGLQKKGPNKRERLWRMLLLDLQARYGGFSQREADLKAQRAASAP